jgi:hypothetical protein
MWLPDHKLLAFGAANGREAPYMWYGMDPRTGNVTTTFPIDSYPQPQFLYGGSDATVRELTLVILFMDFVILTRTTLCASAGPQRAPVRCCPLPDGK